MQNKLPNLFIVGAPKAGTSWLYEVLKSQPGFYFPQIKELNFYNEDDLDSYYKDYKVKTRDAYLKHFKTATDKDKYRVDSSVSYFISESARLNIHKDNPDAKIIIIVRDPIKRAYSHYQMDKRMGNAKLSFTSYLKNSSSYNYKQYVENSSYFKYISRYNQVFGKENVLLLTLEDLEDSIKRLTEFLKISVILDNEYDRKVNPSQTPKNRIGRFFLSNRSLAERLKNILPNGIIGLFKKMIYSKQEYVQITEEEYTLAKEVLQADIDKMKSNFPEIVKEWKIQ